MTTVWFVVPAHGRLALAEVCFRQLKRTCAALAGYGIRAYAVVVADDENLETAAELGFATVRRENVPLGRKWNDGYELACTHGEADYVIPLGSDDWIDPVFVAGPLPDANEIRCARLSAIVNETATRIARLRIPYDGGDGVRILPVSLLKQMGYRPAEEDRDRAIDTSVMRQVTRYSRPRIFYHDLHPLQIVDWKSAGGQLNSYEACLKYVDGADMPDPFGALAAYYPAEALAEMRALHTAEMVAA